MKLPSLKKSAKAADKAKRPLSGAALKAQQAKAAKVSEATGDHEHVVLTSSFEVHDANGLRTFKAGPRSLPKALAAEARRRGLVAVAQPE
jgi:hypothetical protein